MTRIPKGQIRPKISTMPRQQTEAAAYLDIYKLVIEKKRLRQELEGMDDRRQQICDRLVVLEQQITALEKTAHEVRDAENELNPAAGKGGAAAPERVKPPLASISKSANGFDTLSLDY
jgi:chromosome segregation ATPase